MTSKKVIERLKERNWVININNEEEYKKLMNYCSCAGVNWNGSLGAIGYSEIIAAVQFKGSDCGMTYLAKHSDSEYDITEWFFKEINKGDDVENLVPENDNEQMLVNALLAKVRKIEVECLRANGEWTDSQTNNIDIRDEYRIKPKHTPLPIPVELWKLIDKKYICAMLVDDMQHVRFFTEIRETYTDTSSWVTVSVDFFNINTDGIDWKTSLTKRPEGV